MKREWRGLLALVAGSCTPMSAPQQPEVLKFADVRQCTFERAGERLFRGLMRAEAADEPGFTHDPQVRLAQYSLPVVFTADTDSETGYMTYRSTVTVARRINWYGLPLEAVSVEEFVPPEIDGLSARELSLAAPLGQVRSVLQRLGSDIDDRNEAFLDDGGCGGSLRLLPAGDRTVIRCEWGC